ncbi:MAG: zinc-dependent metalloprotease, partial [Acidimicrobiaceae bacterium]|nr:zinc-dependent metalloprotease [Acidimicrobiaceae bacterium]
MSELGPFGSGGPFEDLMKNLARLFSSQGPVNWEIARQIALWTSTGGQADSNPEPLTRVRLEELLRVAELHVGEATGLPLSSSGMLRAKVVNKSEWATRTLEAWHPWFERLAAAMTADEISTSTEALERPQEGAEQMAQLFSNLPQLLGPVLFGLQAGAMVGQLAARAMGQYDLPMPRPASDELLFVARTIDDFASDWSLPPDDVRLWTCLREVSVHAVLGRPDVRARLD